MSTFRLEIKTTNAAFEEDPGPELARLLREAADKVENGTVTGILHDYNGNRVGEYGTD